MAEAAIALELSVRLVEAEAKRRVPRQTGRLFSSIHGEVDLLHREGRVGTDVEYAPFVEFGTSIHEIVPVHAMVLAFDLGGTRVFAHSVTHPGTQAHPYLEPALHESEPAIIAFFDLAAARLTGHLAGGSSEV